MPQNCVVASVIAPGKNFLPVCSKITLVFTSFYSKQRFYLCSAKWRWFRILFLRTIFTSVFVTKLHFWCSILLEKCFALLATKLDYLWAVYHIKPAFACWQEMRCFEFYITKKSVFAFSSLKHAGLSFIAQKACFGLFAIILGCFRCYCTKKRFSPRGSPWFSLDFTQTMVFLPLHCLRIVFQRTNLFSVSITKLHFGRSILPKKCFDLLATELGYLKPYVRKNNVSFFLCLKYAAFSFIAGKTCFGLFSVKNWAVSSVIAPENVLFWLVGNIIRLP